MCTKLKSVLKGITATLFVLFVDGKGLVPAILLAQKISGDGPPDHLAAKLQTYSLISKYLLQKNDQETP
jgi:hypothetical protein